MSHINIKQISSDDEVGRIVHNELTGPFQSRYVTLDEVGTCSTDRYALYAEAIENFEVHNDDVWVCSFPRSGTTWTQEMVWMIVNDLNYNGAKVNLTARFPGFENNTLLDVERMFNTLELPPSELAFNSISALAKQPSPRFIKSHLQFHLLPQEIRSGIKTPKIIYITRDPRDVCVSLYHLYKLSFGAKSTFENFSKVFFAGKVIHGPYWNHITEYWEKRDSPNILFIKYEDMKNDLSSIIRKVASFLNKNLTDNQIKELEKHLSFESMKKNPAVNIEAIFQRSAQKNLSPKDESFIRSGVVGKYKDELSPEILNRFNEWIKENTCGTVLEEEYKKYI